MKSWMRLIVAALAVAGSLFAAHAGGVDVDGARAIANEFLSHQQDGKRLNASMTDVSLSYTRFSSLSPAVPVFYVFADEHNGGWVIVAADDRAEQVLGYNLSGTIDMDALPCNVRAWFDEYGSQIEYLQQHPSMETRNGKRTERLTALSNIDPLISSTWDQSSPYNTQCPKISNKYPFTGCTATALAQVMNYYQYPTSECLPIPAYVTTMGGLSVPALPATTFDWQNMLNSYSGSYTTANKTAVATLMRYCGQALCMEYGLNGSGAYIELIPYVLGHYFGYDRTAQSYMVSREYYDDDTWAQMLYDELSQGRPLPYSGNNGSSGGHTFIVDGYRNGSFHVNWGWSGDYDGFFQLSAFTPSTSDYTQGHRAVFGIMPECSDVNGDGKLSISDVSALINLLLSSNQPASQRIGDVNHDGKVTISDVSDMISRLLNTVDAGVVETYTVNGVSFDMVKVEGGTFSMGATGNLADEAYSDEFPVHQVTLSSYYMGKTEVTQELWQAVMGNNPGVIPGVTLPVNQVSWDDCQQFIAALNALTGKQFRLPTEAEWEFAARGGVKGHDYVYAGSDDIASVAWYKDNAVSSFSMEVGIKAPNELGLYDMSGNVFEWCDSYWGEYPSDAQTNPQGPSSGTYRVYRGGCWYLEPIYCRVSCRTAGTPDTSSSLLGLRLAL